jgi:hypothetical protein
MNPSKLMLGIFIFLGVLVVAFAVSIHRKDTVQKEEQKQEQREAENVHIPTPVYQDEAALKVEAPFRRYIEEQGDTAIGEMQKLQGSAKFAGNDFLLAFQTRCKNHEDNMKPCDSVYAEVVSIDRYPNVEHTVPQRFGPAFRITNLAMTEDGLKWDETSAPHDNPKLVTLTIDGRNSLIRVESASPNSSAIPADVDNLAQMFFKRLASKGYTPMGEVISVPADTHGGVLALQKAACEAPRHERCEKLFMAFNGTFLGADTLNPSWGIENIQSIGTGTFTVTYLGASPGAPNVDVKYGWTGKQIAAQGAPPTRSIK